MEPKSIEDYAALVKRLKTLSKAQTAFLKVHLYKKLTAGSTLVSKAIEVVSEAGSSNAVDLKRLQEIKNHFKDLKLEDLDVDVTSTQLMMSNELAELRGAVDNALPAGKASDSDRIKILETDNANLRTLLQQAKSELAKGGNGVAPPLPPSTGGASSADVALLESQLAQKDATIERQKAKIESLEAELSGGAKKSAETDRLKAEIASLEKEIEKIRTESEKTFSEKIAQMATAEDRRVKELEAKFEAEKEEMMDAMAQEVEEVEKGKDAEIASLTAEKQALDASLKASSKTTKILADNLSGVYSKAKGATSGYKEFTVAVKKDLDFMKQELASVMSGTLINRLRKAQDDFRDVQEKFRKEHVERKRLHNLVLELKGNIRVFARCRPPTPKEIEQMGSEALCVTFPGENDIAVFNSEKNRDKSWEFDAVFNVKSTQELVYQEVSALVVSVLDGYNVCIFAYGQTGSGKTYTMMGPPEDRGVNTRALDELFLRSRQRATVSKDTITVSVLEVYNEDIRDLLADGGSTDKLEVRQSDQGNYVPGLISMPVTSLQDVEDLLVVADRNRSQACTNMNEHSSRSHMMLTVTVTSESIANGVVVRGKLNLVDLAGSERLAKSGATGQALKEAQNINKSLSALGDVIAARASKQGHVPFRNSTLTYLLQDSLSQDSKTLMIVCVSPVLYNAEETFCSLNFAARARSVELGRASKNVVPAGSSASTSSKKSSGAR